MKFNNYRNTKIKRDYLSSARANPLAPNSRHTSARAERYAVNIINVEADSGVE